MIDAIEFACVSTACSPDSRGRSGAGAGLIRFLAILGVTLIPMAAGALPVDQTPSAADAMMLVTAMRAGAGFHLPEMLTSFTTLPTMGPAPAYFDAVRNRVVVRVPGTVLDGYDFRGTRVAVAADNVTISNSRFNAVAGFFTVDQYPPYSGMTIDSCLFDGEKVNRDLEAFIGARLGKATITNNRMIDAPSDMIRI